MFKPPLNQCSDARLCNSRMTISANIFRFRKRLGHYSWLTKSPSAHANLIDAILTWHVTGTVSRILPSPTCNSPLYILKHLQAPSRPHIRTALVTCPSSTPLASSAQCLTEFQWTDAFDTQLRGHVSHDRPLLLALLISSCGPDRRISLRDIMTWTTASFCVNCERCC